MHTRDTAQEVGPTLTAHTPVAVAASCCMNSMFIGGRRAVRSCVCSRRHCLDAVNGMHAADECRGRLRRDVAYAYASCSRRRISYPRWRVQPHLSTSVRPYLRLSDTCRRAERRARLLQLHLKLLLLLLRLLLLTIGGCIAACPRRCMARDVRRWLQIAVDGLTGWTQGRRLAFCDNYCSSRADAV